MFFIELENSFGKISRKGSDYKIFLEGDFNQPNIDWLKSAVVPNNSASGDTAEAFSQTVTGIELSQYLTNLNQGRKQLRSSDYNDSLFRVIRGEHDFSHHDIL